MDERRRAAIDRGIAFLVGAQGADGLWRDFLTPAGEASTWPSAYVAGALLSAGADAGVLGRATDALVRRQRADGGWGYNERTPSDADSTSWAVLLLCRSSRAADPLRRAGAFLSRHQRPRTGGVATYAEAGPIRRYLALPAFVPMRGWCRPHVEVTATAGRAFGSVAPATHGPEAAGAWRFVRSRQDADGSWRSYWWTSPHFATQQAVALADTMHDRASVQRAARWALLHQQAGGGWAEPPDTTPSAFATALTLSVLGAARSDDPRPIDGAVDELLRLQLDDGGWPSHSRLRIPVPPDARTSGDERWRPIRFAPGITTGDQRRLFTSATCVAALAEDRGRRGDP